MRGQGHRGREEEEEEEEEWRDVRMAVVDGTSARPSKGVCLYRSWKVGVNQASSPSAVSVH